jgi:hypothetical protein
MAHQRAMDVDVQEASGLDASVGAFRLIQVGDQLQAALV